MDRMSATAETRTDRTRRSIIAAATTLFLGNGFGATSMDDVAATADVSKQTVYAHFGSKEALFLDVVDRLTGGAGDALQHKVADPVDDRPIEDFLLDFANQQLAIVMTPRLMQLRRLVIGERDRFPDLGRKLHERGPGRSIGRLATAFARYDRLGQIRVADPRAAAGFFNWLVMGAPTNDAMLLGDAAIPSPQALRDHARESVRIFLAAYAMEMQSES